MFRVSLTILAAGSAMIALGADKEHGQLIRQLQKPGISINEVFGLEGLEKGYKVTVSGTKATNEDLKALAQLPGIGYVEFAADTKVVPETISQLEKLPIIYLTVYSPISDSGAEAMVRLSKLEFVTAQNSLLTDDGVAHLSGLANLRALNLASGRKIKGKTLHKLKSCKKLETVYMADCRELGGITDLSGLKESPKLSRLDFTLTNVNDSDARAIAQISTIKTLSVGSTQITDAGVQAIATLPGLEHLNVSRTKMTAASIPVLCKVKTLKSVDVTRDNFKPDEINVFRTSIPGITVHLSN